MRYSALLALLAAAACASGGGPEESDDFVVDFDATLQPVGDSGVTGSARAVASLGQTGLTVEIDGGRPGGRHAWHVHQGRCGSGGAIVGDPSDYPPLEPGGDGGDRVITTIGVQLVDDADYHINVHAAGGSPGPVVACGRLVD